MTETLSPAALCSDEDVRIYLGLKLEDVDGEPVDPPPDPPVQSEDRATLIRLTNAASEVFADESQRIWVEPVAEEDEPATRYYTLTAAEVSRGLLRIDDCTEVLTVTYRDRRDAADTGTALDTSAWYPITPEPGHPITSIGWYFGSPLMIGHYVAVKASWGWPVVPEKVRQAVIYTAAEWYARDVEKFSGTFSIDEGRVVMPHLMPSQVLDIATSFRRWRLS